MANATKRKAVTERPVWEARWKKDNKAANVRRFLAFNPIFTKAELILTLGEDHCDAAEALVRAGQPKRPATGIYTAPGIDSGDPEVTLLIQLTGARPATPDQLAAQGRRIADAAVKAAPDPSDDDPAARLKRWHAKAFRRREARDYLGQNPEKAIEQLIDAGVIVPIHTGIYRRTRVAEHGPEVVAWAFEGAEVMGEVARSIDASERAHSKRDNQRTGAGAGTLAITSITLSPSNRPDRKDKIYVNFNRLGSIYAEGGGRNNRANWNSYTPKSQLTKAAAEFVAEQIFGSGGIAYGDLAALAQQLLTAPNKAALLPQVREKSCLNHERREDDDGPSRRMTALREARPDDPSIGAPCILYVDDREDMRIVEALQGVPNLAVVACRLDVGDFHARWGDGPSDQLYIERKTAADFEKSLRDGRMEEQGAAMGELVTEGFECYLLQQGDPYTRSTLRLDGSGRVPSVAVTAAQKARAYIELATRGVRVIPTGSWQGATRAIHDLLAARVPSLPVATADPKTSSEADDGCATPENTAAGRPDDPSSE